MNGVGKVVVSFIAVLAGLAGILTWAKIDPPWTYGAPPASPVVVDDPAATPLGLAPTPESGSPGCEPTYSCSTPNLTRVETMICTSVELCRLDHEVSIAYTKALSAKLGDEQKPVKREQYYWLKHTRNKCKNERCLIEAHEARVKDLAK